MKFTATLYDQTYSKVVSPHFQCVMLNQLTMPSGRLGSSALPTTPLNPPSPTIASAPTALPVLSCLTPLLYNVLPGSSTVIFAASFCSFLTISKQLQDKRRLKAKTAGEKGEVELRLVRSTFKEEMRLRCSFVPSRPTRVNPEAFFQTPFNFSCC